MKSTQTRAGMPNIGLSFNFPTGRKSGVCAPVTRAVPQDCTHTSDAHYKPRLPPCNWTGPYEVFPRQTHPTSILCLPLFNYYYLFLAALGLHCCSGFSTFAVSGVCSPVAGVWASHRCGFSCCGAQALDLAGFRSCST